MCELTFPSGLIYIGIVIIMAIIITVLAMVNANQKHEIEYLRNRRSGEKKSEAAGAEAEKTKPQISDTICFFCSYRDLEIPKLKRKISCLTEELKNADIRYEIAQSTIRKLRTDKGENQNDKRS